MHPIGSVSMLSVIASQAKRSRLGVSGCGLVCTASLCSQWRRKRNASRRRSKSPSTPANKIRYHNVLMASSAHELTDNSLSKNLNSCYVHNSRLPDGSSAMNTPVPCCYTNAHERPSALEPIPARRSGTGRDGGWNVAEKRRARRKNLEADASGFFPL